MSNIFCIGDVHGCFFTLEKLVKKLPNDARIIFTGDLCDKGLHTKEVIEFIIESGHEAIKGNHDALMEAHLMSELQNCSNSDWMEIEHYGGYSTVESYRGFDSQARRHVEFIQKLPHYKLVDGYFITHGFGLPYFERREESCMQIQRNRVYNPYPDWEDWESHDVINVFGHCDFDEVKKGKNYFGIDTGAVYGNKLTAFELGTHKIIQQNTMEKDLR